MLRPLSAVLLFAIPFTLISPSVAQENKADPAKKADPVRIGILARDRGLPLRVLFGRIDAGLRAWEARLPTLTEADGTRIGLHPRLGEMPAPAVLERFVVGHAEDHIAQLRDILAARVG